LGRTGYKDAAPDGAGCLCLWLDKWFGQEQSRVGLQCRNAMNNPNENQHFVSKVLLKRFKIPRNPLQCYQVQTGEWIQKSPDNACSSPGYNQFLGLNQVDEENKLEADFSAIESRLPKVFNALEEAAKKSATELSAGIYEDLCNYCAYLKLIAPYAKPGAVAAFMFQLNWELERGEKFLLRDLKIPEDTIALWRKEYASGKRVIVEAENALQLFYKFQFNRSYRADSEHLKTAHWTVFNSPIELPISDVGLIPIGFEDLKLCVYLLPFSPRLLLKGLLYFDQTKNSPQRIVKSLTLGADEAEYIFDSICSSAIIEIVCSRMNADVPIAIRRAKSKGIKFLKIQNSEGVLSAGLKKISDDCVFRIVAIDEYVKSVHSFVMPPD
jgi:hypothetical protein